MRYEKPHGLVAETISPGGLANNLAQMALSARRFARSNGRGATKHSSSHDDHWSTRDASEWIARSARNRTAVLDADARGGHTSSHAAPRAKKRKPLDSAIAVSVQGSSMLAGFLAVPVEHFDAAGSG